MTGQLRLQSIQLICRLEGPVSPGNSTDYMDVGTDWWSLSTIIDPDLRTASGDISSPPHAAVPWVINFSPDCEQNSVQLGGSHTLR